MSRQNLLGLKILALALTAVPQMARADYPKFNPNGHDEGIDTVEPQYSFEEQSVRGEDAKTFAELLGEAGIEKDDLIQSRATRIEGTAYSCSGEGTKLSCEIFDPKSGRNRRLEGESAQRWSALVKKYSKEGARPTVKCETETLRMRVYPIDPIHPRPCLNPRLLDENCTAFVPPPKPGKDIHSLITRCRVIVPKVSGFR